MMKPRKLSVLLLCAALFPLGMQARSKPRPHRVMSCNVRVSSLAQDDAIGQGWDTRKEVCLKVILAQRPDIVCMQEVIPQSYAYFAGKMKGYDSYGFAGPDMDRYPEGYHGIAKNVIFYATARYELVSAGGYWLSETPLAAGSASWGSARPRQCNWVRLRDRHTGREFRVLNLHLDHKSGAAKESQIGLALDECAQYADDFPQLLAGDFNADRTERPVQMVGERGWTELYEAVHGPSEAGISYHAFKGDTHKSKRGRIDFLFGRNVVPKCAWLVKDKVKEVWPSDHYFLASDVLIP